MHDFERRLAASWTWACWSMLRALRVLAERLAGEDVRWPPVRRLPTRLLPGIVRPTYRGPLGDRADGILVRGESPMREMMPYLMRGATRASPITKPATTSRGRSRGSTPTIASIPTARATLFDLFLWAAAYVAHARPGINRFVSGRRIYQRREVAISFAAKKRFDLAAELVTIKLRFPRKQAPFSRLRRADRRRRSTRPATGRRGPSIAKRSWPCGCLGSCCGRSCGAIGFSTTAICCPANSSQTTHFTPRCLSPTWVRWDWTVRPIICTNTALAACSRRWDCPKKRSCHGRRPLGNAPSVAGSLDFGRTDCRRFLQCRLHAAAEVDLGKPGGFRPVEPRRGDEA